MPDFKFELKIGERTINASVKLPAEAIRPADLLPILQGFSNAVIGVATADETVSCAQGCGACCRQVVPISETEAIYLIELINEMPAERKAVIINRFSEAVNKIEAAGLSNELKMESLGTVEQRRKAADAYFQLGIACPFLENESCGIYLQRPLACREYLVTSPPVNCSTPTADTVAMIQMPSRLSYILYRFGDGTAQGPVKFIPLPLMFQSQYPEQPKLPGPELFENFFRAVTVQAE